MISNIFRARPGLRCWGLHKTRAGKVSTATFMSAATSDWDARPWPPFWRDGVGFPGAGSAPTRPCPLSENKRTSRLPRT